MTTPITRSVALVLTVLSCSTQLGCSHCLRRLSGVGPADAEDAQRSAPVPIEDRVACSDMLQAAADRGPVALAQELRRLDVGPSDAVVGWLLCDAIRRQNRDCIECLLAYGMDRGILVTVKAAKLSVLCAAVQLDGSRAFISWLLTEGFPLSVDGEDFPVQAAASTWHETSLLRLLFEAGASPFIRPRNGDTLLHFAATGAWYQRGPGRLHPAFGRRAKPQSAGPWVPDGYLETVRLLLARGVSPDVKNDDGHTFLDCVNPQDAAAVRQLISELPQ
jgi:hypothetical protein